MYSELFKLHHRSFSLSFFSQVHMLHLVPQWQSAERHRKLKVMMQDRPDLIKSELAGLAFDSLQQVFRKVDIAEMFAAEPLPLVQDQTVFLVIDPAAAGPPHIHWVARGTGTPKDRDEFNRRDVCECDG